MGKHTRKPRGADEPNEPRSTLGELIHAAVRRAIEAAVEEELAGALGADRYEREVARRGYRNGTKEQPLAEREVVYVYLDALMLRVRSAGKVVSAPVLVVVGVLTDGQKVLLTLELCSGGESYEAWKGCLDGLGARGLKAPLLTIIDGHPGLRRAVAEVWPRAAVQRCCVHKLRNMERKAPKHALAEVREDFHEIVYAPNAEAARTAWTKFERTWGKRCPGV